MLRRAIALLFLAQCRLLNAQVAESAKSPALPKQQPVLAGDPFDARTGVYYREYHDLFVPDTIPIDFVRTQRNLDSRLSCFWRRLQYFLRHVYHRRRPEIFVGRAGISRRRSGAFFPDFSRSQLLGWSL